MTAFGIRLRRQGRLVAAAVAAAVTALALLLVWLISRSRQKNDPAVGPDEPLARIRATFNERVAAANARAAVEATIAETRSAALEAELRAALSEKQASERRRRLAELGNRLNQEHQP
jgi:hypothetical protein